MGRITFILIDYCLVLSKHPAEDRNTYAEMLKKHVAAAHRFGRLVIKKLTKTDPFVKKLGLSKPCELHINRESIQYGNTPEDRYAIYGVTVYSNREQIFYFTFKSEAI